MTPSSRGVSFTVSGKGQAGASAGLTAEKNNHLLHEQQEAFTKEMGQAKNQEERFEVLEKYLEKSRENKEKDPSGSEAMEKVFMDELTKLTKFDNAGISFVVNPELGLHENIKAAKEFVHLSKILSFALPNTTGELIVESAKMTIESGDILSGGKIQVIETGSNIIRNFDSKDLPKEMLNKIIQESGKGYLIYKGHATATEMGIPKSVVFVTDVAVIIVDNFFIKDKEER